VTVIINSMRSEQMHAFRQSLVDVGALLLDDFGFVLGKERSQEELSHRFEELLNRNAQIIVTSDRALSELGELDSRLRGQFDGGLIVELGYPVIPARLEIVRREAAVRGLTVDEATCSVISERAGENPRKLQGVIVRIAAEASLRGVLTDVKGVRDIVEKVLPERIVVTPVEILTAVAKHYGLTKAELLGPSNARAVVLPRQMAFYLIKQHTDLSYPEIGRMFKNKHHSTVMYGIQQVVTLMEKDSAIAHALRQIEGSVR
jgi:chromosomal replication initiator protein